MYKKNILKNVGVSADIVPNDTKILLKHLPVQISATDAQQIRFLKGFRKFESHKQFYFWRNNLNFQQQQNSAMIVWKTLKDLKR